jgi:RNA polymerase sigma-70 factor (ECF subfamily)
VPPTPGATAFQPKPEPNGRTIIQSDPWLSLLGFRKLRFLAWKNTAVLADDDDLVVRARSSRRAADDLALLRCIAGGDRGAFAELCCRLQRPLFGYLMTLARDQAAAEEVLGETWMEIWRQAARFDSRLAVNVWAFSLAHHMALSDPALPHMSRVPTDATAMQNAEHRAILNLAYHQEFSVREIAQILGVSPPIVMVLMSQARQHMKTGGDPGTQCITAETEVSNVASGPTANSAA